MSEKETVTCGIGTIYPDTCAMIDIEEEERLTHEKRVEEAEQADRSDYE